MEVNPTAAQRVLSLPELLHIIIRAPIRWPPLFGLPDRRSIAICMLVNKFWCLVAVKYAWEVLGHIGGPHLRDLYRLVASPERMQWYMDQTTEIDVSKEDIKDLERFSISEFGDRSSVWHRLLQLNFPRLRKVNLASLGVYDIRELGRSDLRLLPFLTPSMTSLHIIAEDLSKKILNSLKVRKHPLQYT